MSTAPLIFKLPQEVITFIFEKASLSHLNLFQCMFVCSRWHPLARTVFYKNALISQNSNIPLLMHCLKTYGFGSIIVNLAMTYKSKWSRKFISQDVSRFLVSNCQNIVIIQMARMNNFYLLRTLEDVVLPKLEKIDVCWLTCSDSPGSKRRFNGANFNHKSTIKSIDMPGRSTREVSMYIGDIITYFPEEEFFGSFESLERYRFQE